MPGVAAADRKWS